MEQPPLASAGTEEEGGLLDFLNVAARTPERLAFVDRGMALNYAAFSRRLRDAMASLEGFEGRLAWTATLELDGLLELLAAIQLEIPVVPLSAQLPDEVRRQRARDANARFAHETPLRTSDDGLFGILFTSGSTGTPKRVMLSRRAIAAAIRASEKRLGFQPDDRWALALPPSHIGGLSVLLRTLSAGRTVILGEGTSALRTVLEMHRATLVSLVPTQLHRLLEDGRRAPANLRVVLVGGAPLSPKLRARAEELAYPVWPTYGMTETCAQAATARPGEPGCGKLLDGFESRIEDGQLFLRGPNLFDGYEGEPPLDDGFFPTGDLARFDDAGNLFVLGRVSDRIISGGENVDPLEVENVLRAASLPPCAVVGMPDDEWGQRVTAVFEGALPGRELERALANLPPYARPKQIARIDALPRTASGKLKRKAIVEALAKLSLRPVERTLHAP